MDLRAMRKYFGEGIVILHDTIYQLTYKEKKIFVYNMDFRKINELAITTDNGQGWGMTTDSKNTKSSYIQVGHSRWNLL